MLIGVLFLHSQPFEINHEDGVPLEHLVTAVSGVSIQSSPNSGIKVLVAANFDAEISEDASWVSGFLP